MSRTKDALPELVGTREAARILNRSVATLKRWRQEARGPAYIVIERRVSYDVAVLLEFLRAHTRVGSIQTTTGKTGGTD